MIRQRPSLRSKGSTASSTESDPREKIKDWCRKLIAFMCTQVGVGGLIVCYALVGAAGFITIETQEPNKQIETIKDLRENCSIELWNIIENDNLFNITLINIKLDKVLKLYQDNVTSIMKQGYDGRTPEEIWSYPAALMFCLSVFTMIGYGNMVPRTQWGKGVTVIYATFGIPLYILYFLNMGKILAGTFKWLYTWLHECNKDYDKNDITSSDLIFSEMQLPQQSLSTSQQQKPKIIVPTTACLWVITFYIFTGTIMFAEWEKWNYLDSVYFCVTSLCKIGIGDFVPGANIQDSQSGKQTKLVINFIYILLGMGLIAMCYNLMREDVRVKMEEMKEDMKLCLEDLRLRFTKCCGGNCNNYRDDEDDYYY